MKIVYAGYIVHLNKAYEEILPLGSEVRLIWLIFHATLPELNLRSRADIGPR